jgi:hypothetical protein
MEKHYLKMNKAMPFLKSSCTHHVRFTIRSSPDYAVGTLPQRYT